MPAPQALLQLDRLKAKGIHMRKVRQQVSQADDAVLDRQGQIGAAAPQPSAEHLR